MAQAKTQPSEMDPAEFIAMVQPERKREEAHRLDALFRRVTGVEPRMWGSSIIGYGAYRTTYASGREVHWMRTGFSPRKANLVLYIMPGYQDYGALLDRLGKHKLGKSCLYLNKLADVDEGVLREIIRTGLDDLAKKSPVEPS